MPQGLGRNFRRGVTIDAPKPDKRRLNRALLRPQPHKHSSQLIQFGAKIGDLLLQMPYALRIATGLAPTPCGCLETLFVPIAGLGSGAGLAK